VTETGRPRADDVLRVEVVPSLRPIRLLRALRRLRMNKLLELLLWPDESIFWLLPALRASRRLTGELAPRAIVVFMMPYSTGLVGTMLSRRGGPALIVNLDDSLTCSDMHPHFPTRLHYLMARGLEDFYARRADATVYVSETNLQAVRSRLPDVDPRRFHLVRYGADSAEVAAHVSQSADFEIAYVGAMTGWWSLIDAHGGPLKDIYATWSRLGRYQRTVLDPRTSSPAFIGRAILQATSEHPEWKGRVKLAIHGNPYPAELVSRALADSGVDQVVSVAPPVPHDEVPTLLAGADLLFLTLPGRTDGSRGGRISAKTYEYLTTNRPILAAVPHGENWDYLADKPGVWLVEPDDTAGMCAVVAELAASKFAGQPMSVNRAQLRAQLSYARRADEFATVIDAAIGHRRGT
jgi:hypothetical protein